MPKLNPGALRAMIQNSRKEQAELIRMSIRMNRDAVAETQNALNTTGTAADQAREIRRAFVKMAAALKSQADATEALEKRLDVIEEAMGQVDDGYTEAYNFLGFGGSPQIVGVLNAWMSYVNKDDTAPNTTFLALAEAIEQYAVDRPEGPMLRVVATLVRAYGWYDSTVGISSILQADTATVEAAAEGDTDALQRILDFLLGQDEDETIATIEAAAAELGIELE